jgi:hypothetical protein
MAKFVEHAVALTGKNFRVRVVGDEFVIRADVEYLTTPLKDELNDPHDDFLSGWAARQRSQKIAKRLPQIRFANASNDEKLLAFVRDFGWWHLPTLTEEVIETDSRSGRTSRLVAKGTGKVKARMLVRQSRSTLRIEQRQFEEVARLIAGLQGERPDLRVIAEPLPPVVRLKTDFVQPKDPFTILGWCHQYVCSVLEEYPYRLVVSRRRGRYIVDDLPPTMSGLKPLLYHLLRRDYVNGSSGPPRIGICRRDDCHDVFAPERKGAKYCDKTCSRLARQRDYYHKGGKKRRRKRLGKARSRQRRGQLRASPRRSAR